MQKKHLIFIASVIVVVAVLFMLPRTVVKNDERSVTEPSVDSVVARSDMQPTDDHRQALGSAQQPPLLKLKQLEVSGQVASYQQQAKTYVLQGKIDSAVVFIELMAQQKGKNNALVAAQSAFNYHSHSPNPKVTAPLNNKAIELLNQALSIATGVDSADLLVQKALCLVAGDKPMEGILLMREIAEKFPESQEAIYHLGAFSVQTGQWDKAVDRFKQLTALNPKHTEGLYYLGVSYFETGQSAQAKHAFKQLLALKADPETEAVVQSYLQKMK